MFSEFEKIISKFQTSDEAQNKLKYLQNQNLNIFNYVYILLS